MGGEPLLAEPLETLPSSPEPNWRQLATSSGRGWRGIPLPWPGVQEGLEPPPAPLATQPSIPNRPKEKLRSAAQPSTSPAPPPWASEGARVKRLSIHPKWTCLGQGTGVQFLVREDSTCRGALKSRAPGLLSQRSGACGLQLLKPTRQQEKPLQGLGLAHTLQPSTAPARLNRRKSARSTEGRAQSEKNKPRWSCLCPIDCGGTRFSKSGLVGLGSQVFLVSCGSSPFRIKSISWSVLISSGTRYDNEQEKKKESSLSLASEFQKQPLVWTRHGGRSKASQHYRPTPPEEEERMVGGDRRGLG